MNTRGILLSCLLHCPQVHDIVQEERERHRLREKERELREEERRRRDEALRQREIERKQREEAARLERCALHKYSHEPKIMLFYLMFFLTNFQGKRETPS